MRNRTVLLRGIVLGERITAVAFGCCGGINAKEFDDDVINNSIAIIAAIEDERRGKSDNIMLLVTIEIES